MPNSESIPALEAPDEWRAGRRIALRPRWRDLVAELPTLGRVRAVVRSSGIALARCVDLAALEIGASVADVVLDGAHLRIDFRAWRGGQVLTERHAGRSVRSIRFDDQFGAAALEFTVPPESWDALDALVTEFGGAPARETGLVRGSGKLRIERPNDDIDVAGLRAAWDALDASTSFAALLTRFGTTRAQAYRLVGRQRAEPVPAESLVSIVARAETARRPLALRVHSGESSLAYIGPVETEGGEHAALIVRGVCTAAVIELDRIVSGWCRMRPGLDEPAIALEYFDGDDHRVASVALPNDRFVDYV